MAVIGVSAPRRDSEPKVRGTTQFAGDGMISGLAHARLVLANEPHGLISAIHADEARAIPGVIAVLTAGDLPIVASGKGRLYEPLARQEVIYAGQPVAIVVAETEALAEDAAQLVEVELEPLEPVLDLEAAAAPGAPRARTIQAGAGEGSDIGDAHAAVAAGSLEGEELSDNVLGTARLANGDVDAELAASEVVVRGRFTTPWMYQGYLETQTATAWQQPDGELVVRTSTQAPFGTRDSLAELFGIATERVRVQTAPLGGAFGGKMMIIEPLVCSAVLATRRPVRLALTRSEDLAATNPAGAEILSVELGADAEGNLTGIRARVQVDRGSTDDFGVESIAAMLSAGPYNWRAHELIALGVATNRVTFGAYRAPTAPPAAFAVESLIDELARQLQIDPLQLRLRNVAGEGDPTPSGQTFPCSAPARAWSASRTIRCGRRARTCPRARGSGSRSAGGRAAMSRPPRAHATERSGGGQGQNRIAPPEHPRSPAGTPHGRPRNRPPVKPSRTPSARPRRRRFAKPEDTARNTAEPAPREAQEDTARKAEAVPVSARESSSSALRGS